MLMVAVFFLVCSAIPCTCWSAVDRTSCRRRRRGSCPSRRHITTFTKSLVPCLSRSSVSMTSSRYTLCLSLKVISANLWPFLSLIDFFLSLRCFVTCTRTHTHAHTHTRTRSCIPPPPHVVCRLSLAWVSFPPCGINTLPVRAEWLDQSLSRNEGRQEKEVRHPASGQNSGGEPGGVRCQSFITDDCCSCCCLAVLNGKKGKTERRNRGEEERVHTSFFLFFDKMSLGWVSLILLFFFYLLSFIIRCVRLQEFATHGEGIIANSDRRSDIDKSYKFLMAAVEEAVERIALDHAKTPPDVIFFGELVQMRERERWCKGLQQDWLKWESWATPQSWAGYDVDWASAFLAVQWCASPALDPAAPRP